MQTQAPDVHAQAPDKISTPTLCPDGDIPTLSAAMEGELTFSKARLEMVLAIDHHGKTQVFRHINSEAVTSPRLSLNTKQVTGKKRKPRTTCPPGFAPECWTDENGIQRCVCIDQC